MAKQQTSQRYIFKLHTSRLRREKWNLTLPLQEARKNNEVISLNDSQMMRWIDELNGIVGAEERVQQIRRQIKELKKLPSSTQNKREIHRLYDELDTIQFKPDYMSLVIDKPKDLYRACAGFTINGVKYVRLLGTTGGVKNSTIVFVSERLVSELRRRVENGRDQTVPQVPAKLEAYKALTCSGSIPVSLPHGILVVNDVMTAFKEDIIMLNDDGVEEPTMQYLDGYDIEMDASDGYGMMCPELARRWSEELKLGYTACGMNTRFSYEKGMVFCFDFHKFAREIAHKEVVKDAWGNEVNINDVELVLTTSMLKLWKCYKSLDAYLKLCEENKYTFGITKTTPIELDRERSLNYQFIQGYHLTEEQIDELIQPTVEELYDVIRGDYRKALLFLRGMNVTADNAEIGKPDYVKALMIDKRMFNDPFVKKSIFKMIKRRLTDAKVGVVRVHGNYSIMCGDPYALCQSMFGIEVTGILKAGQIYNGYWADLGVKEVACFRAPMTSHNNAKKMEVANNDATDEWYCHMKECTIFNAWDTTGQALNGADFDGDLVMETDNKVLVDNLRDTRTIFCVQRNAEKKIVTEDDLIAANIASFGDDIGRTTNWITSMFDVQSMYPVGSVEYETLDYRIKCGQLFQQNAIDKTKGIICKSLPRSWYDYHGIALSDNPTPEDMIRHDVQRRILADKKPYFMCYIYPAMMSQYSDYIKNTNTKCLREFRITREALEEMDSQSLSDEQREFLTYYNRRMPVGVGDCVVNRICRKFENIFDGILMMDYSADFDYTIIKSDEEYTQSQYYAIMKLYAQYNKSVSEFAQISQAVRIEQAEIDVFHDNMRRYFVSECNKVCSNEKQLCNIIADICYRRSGTKQFAWEVCGNTIIENLLEKNGNMIEYPELDENGDLSYCGYRFSMQRKEYSNARDYFG